MTNRNIPSNQCVTHATERRMRDDLPCPWCVIDELKRNRDAAASNLVSVPRELLKRMAYEHTDTNKFSRARQELHAVLCSSDETNGDHVREEYPIRCGDCGRAHILDTVIPSEIWNKVAAEGDTLCTVCIDRRLAAHGLTCEAEFYFCGKALNSKLYPNSYGDQAAARRAENGPAPRPLGGRAWTQEEIDADMFRDAGPDKSDRWHDTPFERPGDTRTKEP